MLGQNAPVVVVVDMGEGNGRNGRSAAHAASHTNVMVVTLAVSHDPMGWLIASA